MKRSAEQRDWTYLFLFGLYVLVSPAFMRNVQHFLEAVIGRKILYLGISIFGVAILAGFFLWFYRMESKERRSRMIWLAVVSAVYFVVFLKMKYPIEREHLIKYGFLSYLFTRALSHQVKDASVYVLAAILTLDVGIIEEGVQWKLISRVGEVRDVWINGWAGVLGQFVTIVLIRPKGILATFKQNSMKYVVVAAMVTIVLLSSFLTVVHFFGHRIVIPDVGEFISQFPPEALKSATVEQLQTLDRFFKGERGEHQQYLMRKIRNEENQPIFYKPWVYLNEVTLHKSFYEDFFNKEQYQEAWAEYLILQTYFKPWIELRGWTFPEEHISQIKEKTAHKKQHYYKCRLNNELYITSFSQTSLWIVTLILVMILWCLYLYVGKTT